MMFVVPNVIDMGMLEEHENGCSVFANTTHLPAIKDAFTMPFRGFVGLCFRAINPGLLIFLCHLEFHTGKCNACL